MPHSFHSPPSPHRGHSSGWKLLRQEPEKGPKDLSCGAGRFRASFLEEAA